LVNKVTGEQFMGRIDALKDESQDNLEVVTKVHKKGDEPKKQHMLNWLEYNQEDRKADLNRALDMYDGEQWFEQSVNEDVRKELERKDETLAEAFRKFRPESIITAVAKSSDTELIRAMGYVIWSSPARRTGISSSTVNGPTTAATSARWRRCGRCASAP